MYFDLECSDRLRFYFILYFFWGKRSKYIDKQDNLLQGKAHGKKGDNGNFQTIAGLVTMSPF